MSESLKKGLDGLLFAIDKRLSHVTVASINLNRFPEFLTKYQSLVSNWTPTSEGPFFLLFRYGHGKAYIGPYQYAQLLQYFMKKVEIVTFGPKLDREEYL